MSPRRSVVEARQSLMRGVLARRDPLLGRIVARARTEFAAYLRFDPEDLAPGAGVILDLLLAALSEARPPTAAELVEYREYGRGRASMGIPLNEVLGVWRMSSREILEELGAVAVTEGASDQLLLMLTNELLDTFDVAIRAYTAGHQEVELARAGREHQHRADFVRALLLGTYDVTEIAAEAGRHGLDPNEEYIAFRSRPLSGDARVRQEPWLRRHTLVASVDGDLAGVVVPRSWTAPADDVAVAVAVGDPARLEDLPRSFQQATRALETMVAFGLRGVQDLAQLGLLPAVVAEPELGDRLVRRYLEPLGSGRSAAMLRETLERHLETGLRVEQTAAAMFLHANTVRYRLSRFTELTGIDLRGQHQAFELWWALQRFKALG